MGRDGGTLIGSPADAPILACTLAKSTMSRYPTNDKSCVLTLEHMTSIDWPKHAKVAWNHASRYKHQEKKHVQRNTTRKRCIYITAALWNRVCELIFSALGAITPTLQPIQLSLTPDGVTKPKR